MGPALETIDPKLGQLFDADPSVTIILDGNYRLQCDSLGWMSKYALCTQNVQPGDAKCSSGQMLIDYLKSVGGGCAPSAGKKKM